MQNVNVPPSELATLVGVIDPQSASTAKSSGWIAAKDYASFRADILVGAIAATGTFDAKLEQASDGSGTGAKDITGKAITQLDEDGDNKQLQIELYPEELDLANGFTHFRLTVTPATAASLLAGAVYGFGPRYGPGTDATSVAEIVP